MQSNFDSAGTTPPYPCWIRRIDLGSNRTDRFQIRCSVHEVFLRVRGTAAPKIVQLRAAKEILVFEQLADADDLVKFIAIGLSAVVSA